MRIGGQRYVVSSPLHAGTWVPHFAALLLRTNPAYAGSTYTPVVSRLQILGSSA